MMPGEMDPKEMLMMLMADVPIVGMGDVICEMIKRLADRVEAEYPEQALKLRDAAVIIAEAIKAVG